MKRIAFVLLLSLSSSVFACAKSAPEPASPSAPSEPSAATAESASTGEVVPPGEAKPGDKSTCPVSGEEFVVTESSPKVEYAGKTYYFCCGGCKAKFEADPAKFTAPKN